MKVRQFMVMSPFLPEFIETIAARTVRSLPMFLFVPAILLIAAFAPVLAQPQRGYQR
jgi:hypothetical protein